MRGQHQDFLRWSSVKHAALVVVHPQVVILSFVVQNETQLVVAREVLLRCLSDKVLGG